jgi:hypothetical protein
MTIIIGYIAIAIMTTVLFTLVAAACVACDEYEKHLKGGF